MLLPHGNILTVNHDDWEAIVIMVDRAKLLEPEDVTSRIYEHDRLPEEATRQKVRLTMGSGDDDVTVGSVRVSLRCAITRTRIKVPGRGRKCGHLQCFDLCNYLTAYQWHFERKCPVCNMVLPIDDLVVDDLLTNVLKETKESVDEIEFAEDGTWKASEPQGGLSRHRSADGGKAAKRRRDSMSSTPVAITNGAAGGSGSAPPANTGSEDAPICLDSSDDDEPAAKAPPATSTVQTPSPAKPAAPAPPPGPPLGDVGNEIVLLDTDEEEAGEAAVAASSQQSDSQQSVKAEAAEEGAAAMAGAFAPEFEMQAMPAAVVPMYQGASSGEMQAVLARMSNGAAAWNSLHSPEVPIPVWNANEAIPVPMGDYRNPPPEDSMAQQDFDFGNTQTNFDFGNIPFLD